MTTDTVMDPARAEVLLGTVLLALLGSFCGGYRLGRSPAGGSTARAWWGWSGVFLWCAAAALGSTVLQSAAPWLRPTGAGAGAYDGGGPAICACGVAALLRACGMGVGARWRMVVRAATWWTVFGLAWLPLVGCACWSAAHGDPREALRWLVGEEFLGRSFSCSAAMVRWRCGSRWVLYARYRVWWCW